MSTRNAAMYLKFHPQIQDLRIPLQAGSAPSSHDSGQMGHFKALCEVNL